MVDRIHAVLDRIEEIALWLATGVLVLLIPYLLAYVLRTLADLARLP